jgi:hypothetical protein
MNQRELIVQDWETGGQEREKRAHETYLIPQPLSAGN